MNLTTKLIESHLSSGHLQTGTEIRLKIDQTLTQDATGTLVGLELEALGPQKLVPKTCVQYVDHNLLQEDFKNADDHIFLQGIAQRFGIWFSRPGNGISHVVHCENFGRPGLTMVGSDSHTPAAGCLGMLAMGVGGIDVAEAMVLGEIKTNFPRVIGVHVQGKFPPMVSAKDLILEILRRKGVRWGLGAVLEYFGDGLAHLSTMDRHVIANMGTELGATSSVFPADENTKAFLENVHRGHDFEQLEADKDASYDELLSIDLGELVPLMALPSSPENVVPVSDLAGEPIYQSYIGSSANPGFRDFAMAAEIVRGTPVADNVSFDINPSSRMVLSALTQSGHLDDLLQSGARIHQTGCNGCIGMGQAPASGKLSLRTVPRNFPGRSGTENDQIALVSPETAAVSALAGKVTDPREFPLEADMTEQVHFPNLGSLIQAPEHPGIVDQSISVVRGPNIGSFPELVVHDEELPIRLALCLGDDISTDEILPAGAEVLPFRSNIEKISEFAFRSLEPGYSHQFRGQDHFIIAGDNYGQGSSREHAALALRFLGLRLVIAKSYARIHRRNLINFGVIPAIRTGQFPELDSLAIGEDWMLPPMCEVPQQGQFKLTSKTGAMLEVETRLSDAEFAVLQAGGRINYLRTNHE